jgi:hypothetical protein
VQDARDGVDELMKMDEMAFMKTHSVNFGPISDRALWIRETQRIQVDRFLILQTVVATVMHMFNPYVVLVELLGPGNLAEDRSCSGPGWALLTAAFLRDPLYDKGRAGSKL